MTRKLLPVFAVLLGLFAGLIVGYPVIAAGEPALGVILPTADVDGSYSTPTPAPIPTDDYAAYPPPSVGYPPPGLAVSEPAPELVFLPMVKR